MKPRSFSKLTLPKVNQNGQGWGTVLPNAKAYTPRSMAQGSDTSSRPTALSKRSTVRRVNKRFHTSAESVSTVLSPSPSTNRPSLTKCSPLSSASWENLPSSPRSRSFLSTPLSMRPLRVDEEDWERVMRWNVFQCTDQMTVSSMDISH